jgi:hypothetical protein
MRLRAPTLVESTTVVWRSLRFRPLDFLVKMWLLNALARTNFPVPVFLKRLAAARLVFIFGMKNLRHPFLQSSESDLGHKKKKIPTCGFPAS